MSLKSLKIPFSSRNGIYPVSDLKLLDSVFQVLLKLLIPVAFPHLNLLSLSKGLCRNVLLNVLTKLVHL